MSKKLIYLASFVLVLSIASSASADLILHWRFDEGSGTTVSDSSGNGHDGTIVGATWTVSEKGPCLEFGGDGDYVIDDAAGAYMNGLSALSVALWIKSDEIGTDSGFIIFENPQGRDSRNIRYDQDMGDGNLNGIKYGTCTNTGDTDDEEDESPINVQTTDWQHICVTWESGAGDFPVGLNLYINGVLQTPSSDETGADGVLTGYDRVMVGKGGKDEDATEGWDGLIDDVRIYDHVLSPEEILGTMTGIEGWPYALSPVPEDGALYENTWANLSWSPGDSAVSHDVYLGDNFDDVNDGTGETFRGNQTETDLFIGFIGSPYPDGLVTGTTYYWRIDEVNDLDPNSPWKGNVWSFTVPSSIAYEPDPADGARYVDPNVELNWTAGLGAEVHYVYFGDNFDDVNSADGAFFQVDTTYTPVTLEFDKTYYWRVDEFDFFTTLKGDVWSFLTVPDIPITDPNLLCWWKFDEGSDTTAVDYSGHNNHGTLMGDPQWVDGQVGGALEFGGDGDHVVDEDAENYLNGLNALTVSMWVKSDVTGTNKGFIICEQPTGDDSIITMRYDSEGANGSGTNVLKMAVTSSEDEQQLESSNNAQTTEWQHYSMVWSSEQQLNFYINGVLDVPTDNQPATTGTTTGCSVLIIGMGGKFNDAGVGGWDGLIDDVRIYNKVLTADDIKEVMRGEPDLAWNPKPANGSTAYIGDATPLNWSPGEKASQHDVYFGIDKDVVADANASTTDIYRGRQIGTSYSPPEGVEWGGGPYYWRIDEYNTDATISTGRIWSFTVADYILIEDFEDYNDFEPDIIFETWMDGWDVDTNGSEVGYANPDFPAGEHFVETNIVHGGSQSMPYFYDNNFKYSEATYSPTQRDWTEEGVGVLSLWFYGDASNAAALMYVALNGGTAVYHDNADAALIDTWTEWTIDLQEEFTGVDLTNVNTLAIGFGDKNNLQAGGSGLVFFDDIRLYQPEPEPEPQP